MKMYNIRCIVLFVTYNFIFNFLSSCYACDARIDQDDTKEGNKKRRTLEDILGITEDNKKRRTLEDILGITEAEEKLKPSNDIDRMTETKEKTKITFKDIGGMTEAKEKVKIIIDFLKTPEKFTALGAKIPKGILLAGSPGVGKTLLAKAVAGEAGVPFFYQSGSSFMTQYMNSGPQAIYRLFEKAKQNAPCIIFIDEIDSIGNKRSTGKSNCSTEEHEKTLNALLEEMDGFELNAGVIVLAATNRPESLDPALIRSQRFDEKIVIDKPNLVDREAIIQCYIKKLKVKDPILTKQLAEQTVGFSGADLATMCNKAALSAATKNQKFVMMNNFLTAMDEMKTAMHIGSTTPGG
ncbi:AAA family ATPase [Candidatus Cardinium sp. cByotN1]|uniref:AAA family ATPase n=1 Tax=Candidatus Cardinium sp. cByotN1 TaxID=2699439 RepID=UPI001FB4BD1A|nr:AAA family ATPase [Candidatus Cardinium sp. cByotN1]